MISKGKNSGKKENKRRYLYLLPVAMLNYVVMVLVLQLKFEGLETLIGISFIIGLGYDLFYAAVVDEKAMAGKDAGQNFSTGIVFVILFAVILAYIFGIREFRPLTKVPWYLFSFPFVTQYLNYKLSSKLKPLLKRHFDSDYGRFTITNFESSVSTELSSRLDKIDIPGRKNYTYSITLCVLV